MIATRYENSNTTRNLEAILRLVNDPNCKEIRLYASPTGGTKAADSDGAATNFPLLAALARYEIPGITEVYVVFDGSFLTAARKSRYLDVVGLLDACQTVGKVSFSATRAPFTSTLDPLEAAKSLLQLAPVVPFNAGSRAQYFALISNVSEADYAG